MKWITRERARVDRIACPWLISRFIDPEAGVPVRPGGPGARRRRSARARSRTTSRTSSWGITARSAPSTPSSSGTSWPIRRSAALARIVRGADTDDRGADAGVGRALCRGHRLPGHEPRRLRQHGAPVPDVRRALRVLPRAGARRRRRPRVLFVCLHGAAKSVIGGRALPPSRGGRAASRWTRWRRARSRTRSWRPGR